MRLLELNGHRPRESNLCSSTLAFTQWKLLFLFLAQAGRRNASPLFSTAQHMRAFLAAMATTARQ